MPLTDREIRNAKPSSEPYRLPSDGEQGMYVEVLPSGVRAFRLKLCIDGVDKRCSLGTYPDVGLKAARKKRDEVRRLAANGVWYVDQKRERRQANSDAKADAKVNQFGTWAERYLAHNEAGWSPNHRRDIRRMIDVDIKPALGRIPAPTLSTEQVQALIDKIVARGALTHAHDVRLYCSAIFKHGNKKRPVKLENPVAYVDVPKAPKAERHPALELDQLGQFLVDLQFAVAEPITRIGMRLLLLTGLRTTELRCGRWSEVDERAREWRIPSSRTKADVVHIVPLADETMALLAQLRRITGDGPLMLPNVLDPDEPMSDSTLLNLLYRMGLKGKMSGHGVRRLFSTWANREGFNRDAIERQLGHVERNAVRAAYNEHDWMSDRRKMMQAWATWLSEQERAAQNVVPIRATVAA